MSCPCLRSSGGANQSHEEVQPETADVQKDDGGNAAPAQPAEDRDSKILAARERYLARRGQANK